MKRVIFLLKFGSCNFLVLLFFLIAQIIETSIIAYQEDQERHRIFNALDDTLKQKYGETSGIVEFDNGYINVDLKAPEIDDEQLAYILKTLCSVSYNGGIDTPCQIVLNICNTSITFRGVEIITREKYIPISCVSFGSEVVFTNETKNLLVQLWRMKYADSVFVIGAYTQEELDQLKIKFQRMRKRYFRAMYHRDEKYYLYHVALFVHITNNGDEFSLEWE